MLESLSELLDADSAVDLVCAVARRPGAVSILSSTRIGIDSIEDADLIARCVEAFESASDHVDGSDVERWRPVGLVGKAAASRRLSHCLARPSPSPPDHLLACLSVGRSRLQNAFVARERELLALVHTRMSWIYEPDVLMAMRGPEALSPRQRQTLQFLLLGLGEKQIAERMRLSRNTVHHHIKAIHKHFGVSSRSELLARYVR